MSRRRRRLWTTRARLRAQLDEAISAAARAEAATRSAADRAARAEAALVKALGQAADRQRAEHEAVRSACEHLLITISNAGWPPDDPTRPVTASLAAVIDAISDTALELADYRRREYIAAHPQYVTGGGGGNHR